MRNQKFYKNTIFLNFLLAFLYAFTGKLSSIIFVSEKIITFSVFPPEGIALAFALYFGKKIIPGIFLGQLILALINGLNIFQSTGIAIGNSLEALIAIYLWKKYKNSPALENFKDYFYLLGMIVFVLQPFSAVFGNLVLSISSKFSFLNIFYWYIGNVLGQILFTPFLLILFNRFKPKILKNFFINGIIFGTVICLSICLINIKSVFILLLISSLLIIYFLIKNGLICGLFLNIVLYYEILFAKIMHKNIFSTYSNFENALNFDLFIVYNTTLIYIIGVFLEKEKRHSKELEETVKKVTEENQKQFKYILFQKNLVAKAEIISMLTHQWRQPLNKILLLTDLIYTKYKMNNLNPEDMESFRKNIKNEVFSLNKIIEKLNSLNQTTKMENFNIKSEIENILEKSKEKLKNINLITDLKDFDIYFNKNAFNQIFNIILDNAIEAISDKENKQINIKTLKENNNIILIIKDNGNGIENIEKIFEPYYSTKSKNEKGLNLFIAKSLIDKLGAKITAENDNGAVFKISFKKY